jgi:cysteinyl-tRNA synthetase
MYAVSQFERYGQLSGKCLADLRAGARVGVVEAKRDPLDFVLLRLDGGGYIRVGGCKRERAVD